MIAALLAIDLACALLAVVVYWTQVLMRRGANAPDRTLAHWLMRAVSATVALACALILVRASGLAASRLLWFLLYGLVLLLTPVQHGLATVIAGPSSVRVRSIPHLVLNGIAVLGVFPLFLGALVWRAWWFLPAIPFGFALGLRNLRYAGGRSHTSADWRREHAASLMAAGVVLHVALLVLIAVRWPAVLPAAWR